MKVRILSCFYLAIFAIIAYSGNPVFAQSSKCTSAIPTSFGGIGLGCNVNELLKFVEKGSLSLGGSRMGYCFNEGTCREYVSSTVRNGNWCADNLKTYNCGAHGFQGIVFKIPEIANGVFQKTYWACLQKETVDRFAVCELTIENKLLIPIENTSGNFIFANNKLIYFRIMFQDNQLYKDLCADLGAKYGQCKKSVEIGNNRCSFVTDGILGLAYGGNIGAFHGCIELYNLSELAKIVGYDRPISESKKNATRELEKQKVKGLFK